MSRPPSFRIQTVAVLTTLACGCAMPMEGEGEDGTALAGDQQIDDEARAVGATTQDLTVTTCSDSQNFVLYYIYLEAQALADKGYDYQAFDPNRFWAQYWFGYPSQASSVLANIRQRIRDGNLDIICDQGHPSCNGFTARAQGAQTVRLCSTFWNRTFEEMVVIFLHEVAHHSGAWRDIYGVQQCLLLAQTNPTSAAQNGPSYQHYYNSVR